MTQGEITFTRTRKLMFISMLSRLQHERAFHKHLYLLVFLTVCERSRLWIHLTISRGRPLILGQFTFRLESDSYLCAQLAV